ncbi:MAG: DUF3782 domain-containing protein [Deltaproteobacteria bacterium]|nr:DUF3782 domain-containing protein [Deltaproteobacteria bacterium]
METTTSESDLGRAMRELIEQSKDTDRRLKALGQQIGGLGNRLGEFVEGVVRPGLVRLFRERGVDVHQTLRDLEASRDGEAAQIDLLVVNDGNAVAVEVKSRLDPSDVDDHMDRLGKFKRLFPQYRDTRLHGAVAAMVISDDVARYAERRGLFIIGQAGDDAVLLNSEGFEPEAW